MFLRSFSECAVFQFISLRAVEVLLMCCLVVVELIIVLLLFFVSLFYDLFCIACWALCRVMGELTSSDEPRVLRLMFTLALNRRLRL